MRFQRETATAELIQELMPLLTLHYQEIAHYKDIPLDIDVDRYAATESSGGLRLYTARDEQRAAVGYAVYCVASNAHYKSSLQAVQDVLFIHPQRRGFGREFILWCDEQLAKDGVEVVYHHVKKAHDFGAMLKLMGYEAVETIYGRRL